MKNRGELDLGVVKFAVCFFECTCFAGVESESDLNGSVGSIADLKPKGPGFEFRIRQGLFPHVKEVEGIGLVCLDSNPRGEVLTYWWFVGPGFVGFT